MKLIIFDCDGTLVDSERLCNLALQYQLAEVGIEYKAADLVAKYCGVKFNVILASIASDFSVTFPDSFETEYRLKVSNLFDEQLKENEGVSEMLDSLTVPYCLASSAPRAKIEHALKVTGLEKYFNNKIFSAYEVGSWKPEPDLFLHAAKAMNVDPADCWVIEDSTVGLQAANNANMKCVHYSPELSHASPLASVHIQHMSELLQKIT